MSGEQGTTLRERFDAVVMLTASDWHTEPRSNRYHYATRFARILPVIFVQADQPIPGYRFEPSGHEGIELLHVRSQYTAEQARSIAAALAVRGIKRPLLWSYRGGYHQVMRFVHSPFRVYHATEDYYADEFKAKLPPGFYTDLAYFIAQVDLVVAVSHGVRDSYMRHGAGAKVIVLENGCDNAFWKKFSRPAGVRPSRRQTKVAFYQGGINPRLDYALIHDIAAALPDWQFWFCGTRDPQDKEWSAIAQLENVRDLGALSPERVAASAGQADVGIIPFIQTPFITEVSLPLKAFEYVACDLPVVSVPIRALESWPEIFSFAAQAPDFSAAISRAAALRDDPAAQAHRAAAAARQDYDLRFEELLAAIAATPPQECRTRFNVLILYTVENGAPAEVLDCLKAFGKFTRHNFYFMALPRGKVLDSDLSMFDGVLLHESAITPALAATTAQSVALSGAYRGVLVPNAATDPAAVRRVLTQIGGHVVVLLGTVAGQPPHEGGWRFPDMDTLTLGDDTLGASADVSRRMAAHLDAFLEAQAGAAKPYVILHEILGMIRADSYPSAATDVLSALPGATALDNWPLTRMPTLTPMQEGFMQAARIGQGDLSGLSDRVLIRALLLRWIKCILHRLPFSVQIFLLRLLRPIASWLKLL